MKADAQTKAEVLEAMNKFMQVYESRDMEGMLGLVSQDDDLVLIGTGADELRIGLEQFKFQVERDWSQMEALGFNLTWNQVSAAGPVAWVASEGQGTGRVEGQAIEFSFRMTTVLEKRDGEWLLVQSHLSLPAAGQEEGSSAPA